MRRNLQAALLIKQIPGEAVTHRSLTARKRVWPFGSAHARSRSLDHDRGHALLPKFERMSGCYPRVSVWSRLCVLLAALRSFLFNSGFQSMREDAFDTEDGGP